jgi:hypothetical protein
VCTHCMSALDVRKCMSDMHEQSWNVYVHAHSNVHVHALNVRKYKLYSALSAQQFDRESVPW